MQATIKSNSDIEKNSDLDAIMNDIASLKRDFRALAEHLKTGAVDGATGPVASAAGADIDSYLALRVSAPPFCETREINSSARTASR